MRHSVWLLLGLLLAGCGKPEDRPSHAERGQISVKEWRKPPRQSDSLTDEQKERIEQLESIGYLSGTTAGETSDVITVYDPDRAFNGLNFYTSGHLPGAILADMQGKELYRWRRELREIWPHDELPEKGPPRSFWRRALLYPDGSVLGMFAGAGMFKLDQDSNLIWSNLNGAHHDFKLYPDGRILVLTREARVIPDMHPTEPILEDFLVILSPDGEELKKVSLVDAMRNSPFAGILTDPQLGTGDIFHTNTVSFITGEHAAKAPWLKAGNILTCLRNIDALVVVDMESEAVVHTMRGAYRKPHDPQMVAGGRLLLFDNQGAPGGHSRIVEFDPVSSKLHWFYTGEVNYPLSSATLGTVSRLLNGNTLITESENGRALEVTAAKEIVWEFFNPYRVGANDEYIASLFEVVRIPEDFVAAWLSP